MPLHRTELPQLAGELFLTDGGLETTLIFVEGFDLPEFAAFVLLESETGRDVLCKYYRRYADIAVAQGLGFILESMTWRASRDWGRKLGYSDERIVEFNREGIDLLQGIRRDYASAIPHMVISGCLGPRGDGYDPKRFMTAKEAEAYHRVQIATFRGTKADMVTAYTIPYIAEGVGIALAAEAERMPIAIGFTVETDGNLPSGESLEEAVTQVDKATGGGPAYYMINCAHPTHFDGLPGDGTWQGRIKALRANASSKSHAELDEATALDAGDPKELAAQYLGMRTKFPKLSILGGCCGTDHRHILEIGRAFRQQDQCFEE